MTPHGKAKRLVRLAVDLGTTEAERISAALRACQLIAKHGLLSPNPFKGVTDKIPEDMRESVEAVSNIVGSLTDPAFLSSVRKAAKSLRRR